MPCRGGPLPSRRGALRFIRCRLERVAIATIHYFYWLSVVFLLSIWVVVFIRTMKGVLSGKIFAPTH